MVQNTADQMCHNQSKPFPGCNWSWLFHSQRRTARSRREHNNSQIQCPGQSGLGRRQELQFFAGHLGWPHIRHLGRSRRLNTYRRFLSWTLLRMCRCVYKQERRQLCFGATTHLWHQAVRAQPTVHLKIPMILRTVKWLHHLEGHEWPLYFRHR